MTTFLTFIFRKWSNVYFSLKHKYFLPSPVFFYQCRFVCVDDDVYDENYIKNICKINALSIDSDQWTNKQKKKKIVLLSTIFCLFESFSQRKFGTFRTSHSSLSPLTNDRAFFPATSTDCVETNFSH